uniref:Uncharacterized protein n=1 Tax=Cacopsylla melanoneura TaxID=428564 RepID=A0A8D8W1S0_9HEMI
MLFGGLLYLLCSWYLACSSWFSFHFPSLHLSYWSFLQPSFPYPEKSVVEFVRIYETQFWFLPCVLRESQACLELKLSGHFSFRLFSLLLVQETLWKISKWA